MGRRNYLIEGVSGAGKSAVCRELRRRGLDAVDGDNELAYQGDPRTGAPTPGRCHEHHIWDVDQVLARIADPSREATWFCGGSRNFHHFIDRFDGVFVLELDVATLNKRLDSREDDDWGQSPDERALILRLHRTREDLPPHGVSIDATRSLEEVVDEILRRSGR